MSQKADRSKTKQKQFRLTIYDHEPHLTKSGSGHIKRLLKFLMIKQNKDIPTLKITKINIHMVH